jgi:hypothetical protein
VKGRVSFELLCHHLPIGSVDTTKDLRIAGLQADV